MRRPSCKTTISYLVVCSCAVFLWGRSHCLAQDRQPGEPLQILIPGSQVDIRFRWCPAGEIRSGDPASSPETVKIERGFYLSESEITQAQFAAVLGQARFDALTKRFEQRPGVQYSQFIGADYPVFMVSVSEAVEFCATLERELTNEVSGLESIQVRIPVCYEWQYACLGREHPDSSAEHFADWPPDWRSIRVKDFEGRGETNLDSFLTQYELQGSFSGTQFDLVTALRNAPEKKKAALLRVLEAFLKPAVGLEHDLGVSTSGGALKKSYEGGQPTGRPNMWQLRHMHTNAFEWTWKMSNALGNIDSEWDRLKRGDTDFLRTIRACRMGGDYATTQEWEAFTAWYTVEKPFPLSAQEQETLAINTNAGIRLWYRTNPAPMWLVQVRNKALTGDESTLKQARDKVLVKMTRTDAENSGGRIDFYSALAK